MRNLTLSSALYGFTAEFEMGSGGSHTLLPPGKNCLNKTALSSDYSRKDTLELSKRFKFNLDGTRTEYYYRYKTILGYIVKPHDQLVHVSSMPHSTYTPCLSTL